MTLNETVNVTALTSSEMIDCLELVEAISIFSKYEQAQLAILETVEVRHELDFN